METSSMIGLAPDAPGSVVVVGCVVVVTLDSVSSVLLLDSAFSEFSGLPQAAARMASAASSTVMIRRPGWGRCRDIG